MSARADLAAYCAATERMFVVLGNVVHRGPVWSSSHQVPMFFVLARDTEEAERKGRAVLLDANKPVDGHTAEAFVSVTDEWN